MSLLSLLITLYCLLFTLVPPALAQTMLSPSYQIRLGNFNMTRGQKSSSSYSLTDTVGQTAAGLFTSSGYAVLSGFQYLYTLYPFSFSLSSLGIDLGSLIPNTFASASHNLVVSAPRQGYSVTAYERTRLGSGGDFIPDTPCDSGPCTETTASPWTSTSVYGFGYNMSGNDIPATFASSSYFRPFPDLSAAESPAVVMSSTAAGISRTATATYKANVSANQETGDYTTEIIYIATPSY